MELIIKHEVNERGAVSMVLFKDGKEWTQCSMMDDVKDSYNFGIGLILSSANGLLSSANPFVKKSKKKIGRK